MDKALIQAVLHRNQNSLISVQGVGYRSVSAKRSSPEEILSGEGARKAGGRWNSRGVAAVYLSLTPETAMAESLAHHRYYQLPIEQAMPRIFVAVRYQLRRVLDLTDTEVRRKLKLSQKALLDPNWRTVVSQGKVPLSQQVSGAVFEFRIEALLVRSAAHKTGKNLVVFPKNLHHSSKLDVDNSEKLPKNGK